MITANVLFETLELASLCNNVDVYDMYACTF